MYQSSQRSGGNALDHEQSGRRFNSHLADRRRRRPTCKPYYTQPSFKSLLGKVPPLPLTQARPRSQKSGQNGGSTPTPCLDKAVHARDTRGSKRVGEPLDGDGEGLRMGKSTLSKAALCSISFPFRMYFKWM